MFDAEPEPKVVRVTGEEVRQVIRTHIDQCKKAIASFEVARQEKRTGADWEYATEKTSEMLKTAELVLPVIAEGPFDMSCTQWIRLVNRFAEVLDADRAMVYAARRQAEDASRSRPAGVGQ